MKTLAQIELKATFFHSELRIRVGLSRRSWNSCQRTKQTSNTPETTKYAMVDAWQMLLASPEMILYLVSKIVPRFGY